MPDTPHRSETAEALASAVEEYFRVEWTDGRIAPPLALYLSPHSHVENYANETGDCAGPGFVARRYTAAGLLEQQFLSRHPGVTIED